MQKVFVILAIKYPACIQYKQNIYMYFKPYEKENSLQSDFEWFSLKHDQVHMFHHLNLPVQVYKVLIFTSSC